MSTEKKPNVDELKSITSNAKASLKLINKRKRKLEKSEEKNENENENKNKNKNKNKNEKFSEPNKKKIKYYHTTKLGCNPNFTFNRKKDYYQEVDLKYHHEFTYRRQLEYNKLPKSKRSILFIKYMPTGLEEHELNTYFRQFGKITRLCVKRNKFGRCLRMAAIEFDSPNTAQIARDALYGSSLYGTQLFFRVMPNDPEVATHNYNNLFRSTSVHQGRLNKQNKIFYLEWLRHSTIANLYCGYPEFHQNLLNDENAIKQSIEKFGIKYDFDGFQKEIDLRKQQLGVEKNLEKSSSNQEHNNNIAEEQNFLGN